MDLEKNKTKQNKLTGNREQVEAHLCFLPKTDQGESALPWIFFHLHYRNGNSALNRLLRIQRNKTYKNKAHRKHLKKF